MANKVAAAALQYSKWLSRFICWVWAIYRFAALIVAGFAPSTADALTSAIGGMDTIMMINVSTYLVNSLGEKWLYSDRLVARAFDKGWFKALMARANIKEEDGEDDGDDTNG